MMIRHAIIVQFCFCFTVQGISQEFAIGDTLTVAAEVLNVRNGPSEAGSIIGKLSKGDEVRVIGVEGAWLQVDNNGPAGYVSSAYVDKAMDKGFVEWFKEGALYWGLIVFTILFGAQVSAKRVSDKRFKGGIREGTVAQGALIKSGLISAVIGTLVGFFYAIYMWWKH